MGPVTEWLLTPYATIATPLTGTSLVHVGLLRITHLRDLLSGVGPSFTEASLASQGPSLSGTIPIHRSAWKGHSPKMR